MINSRDLNELEPIVKEKAIKLKELCNEQNIDIIYTSTYRDYESQNSLYAIGRTTTGKKITNAKGGYSYHNFRVAFDIVPIVHGKAIWNDIGLFNKIGSIGQSIGLEWGGSWKSIIDRPHFQYTQGLTLADFRAGKKIKG